MLRAILHAGTSFARSAADAQRVRLVNAITLAAITIIGVTQPANMILEDRLLSIINLCALAAFAVVYRLNSTGHPLAAASLMCLLAPVSLVSELLVKATISGGTQVFLLVAALLPFLAFPAGTTVAAVAVSLVSTGMLIILVVLGFGQVAMTAELGQPGYRLEIVHTAAAGLVCLFGYLTWRVLSVSETGVERERARSEALLFDLFPRSVARQLQRRERIAAERHGDASVLFCRVVVPAESAPDELLRLLSGLFAAFDDVCSRHGVEKIKTFGHSYMAASGVPQARADHAEALAGAALEMLTVAARCSRQVEVRIGVHAGPVVAGVIGRNRYSYDLWGDVVNTAQRMEAHGIAGAVQVSGVMFSKINHRFRCEAREPIQIKGKLVERTYLLRSALPSEEAGR